MKIIDIELFKLNDNLKHNDTEYKELALEFDKTVCSHIFKNGINEEYGARPLKRCIETEISTPLARKILEESITDPSTIKVSFKKGKVQFDVEKKVEEDETTETPFYLTEDGHTTESGNGS
jgi:ATP-dependent Clp protease ATP-binding subunit ClpA